MKLPENLQKSFHCLIKIMTINSAGFLDHIDLNVRNLKETKEFYSKLFVEFLGWKIIYDTEDYFMVGHLPGLRIGFSEVEKGKGGLFDRNKLGLHHFAIRAGSRDEVDKIYKKLLELEAEILDSPKAYPEYSANFYAVYYLDPNGFKMEFVSYT